jgi:L-ascorbate metabolism protein UlaG (beta-lactamase superfamily)
MCCLLLSYRSTLCLKPILTLTHCAARPHVLPASVLQVDAVLEIHPHTDSLCAACLIVIQVDAVFNLELPSSAAHYAHRAGRTGRMGAPGLVMTFVAPGERFVVERLSKKLGVPIVVSV